MDFQPPKSFKSLFFSQESRLFFYTVKNELQYFYKNNNKFDKEKNIVIWSLCKCMVHI